jgi:DNA-binding response OmpR family regulator
MMTPTATVFVIDDDKAVRKSLGRLLGAAHYRIELFKSASEFLSRSAYPDPHASLSRRARTANAARVPSYATRDHGGCSINKLALSSEWRKRSLKPIAAMLGRSWGSLR